MNSEESWLLYYKNSLSDSENLAVDINRVQNLFRQKACDLATGTISSKNATAMLEAEERRVNRLKGISKKDKANWIEIQETYISIAPFQLEYFSENGVDKKSIQPFWITAKVNRSGQLITPKLMFPLVVRNYLYPIADQNNSFIFSSIDTILEAEEIQKPFAEEEGEEIPWDVYWEYICEVFSFITKYPIYGYRAETMQTSHETLYFANSSRVATAKSILFLYQNLLNKQEGTPLFSKIINPENRVRKKAITDEGFLRYNGLHLGQMTDSFPLSISQRKTLLSYLSSEANSVTAVNGPPGTGKTTLLQSLVATEFVKSAIHGEEPPVILACSSNNQAVTNIIDSFINSESTLTGLGERWLPNFTGYATYLPSNSKSEKSLQNINYLKGNMFGYEGTLCELDNETYLEEAKAYFYGRYLEYYKQEQESFEEICEHLQEEIHLIQDALIEGSTISRNYIKAIDKLNNVLLENAQFLEKDKIPIELLKDWKTIVDDLKTTATQANFKDKVLAYFSIDIKDSKPFRISQEQLDDKKQLLTYLNDLATILKQAIHSNIILNGWKLKNNIQGFPFVSEEKMWEFEYQKLERGSFECCYFYDEIDVKLRHKTFLLATHYWEARWLLATSEVLEENSEKGTGELTIMAQWHRRAMLTPCFVATFYMAPTHFVYSQFKGEDEKPAFEYFPLLNFIDLLIIDEAGQVTPEVSIPLFALAKKAMVVGDLKQIEPIWSIPPKIDLGNLLSLDIIDYLEQSEYYKQLGFLASSGSIMKMAQNACEFEMPLGNFTEKGLVLLEHRRCNDEIIGFCNELAYGGILKPMKGTAKESQAFPSMMAYHVEGVSERKYNSRHNMSEVNSIIAWLQQNREHIQEKYNVNSIESVLGIITPFASQKTELSKALIDSGYKINNIKLGTVHALQGAERSIVLFSSVYANEDEGTLFFDRDDKPNMLNVAVSRAKDSFILFGDTRVFDETKNSPSGVLKRHLTVYELPK